MSASSRSGVGAVSAGRSWHACAIVAVAWALAWAAGIERASAGSTAERIASLEAQIAAKRQAIEQLERRNVDLKRGVDANPTATGANFSARQEMRTNARYVSLYEGELHELERVLTVARTAPPPEPSAKPKSRASPPTAAPPTDEATDVDDGVAASPAAEELAPVDPGALDRGQVRELMRGWALGRSGVPGMRAYGEDDAPLAVVMAGLDWSLDWRELLAGASLGAALGALVPWGATRGLRRRLPARAPVVGAMSRKWVSANGTTGTPSKQWLDLSSKAAPPARRGAVATALVAVALLGQALASWIGWGSGLGTPGVGGEVAMLVAAVATGSAASWLWRRRSFAPAFGAACGTSIACVVPVALASSPFGGRGAWVWAAVLGSAVACQMGAVTALWPLTSPRAAVDATRRVTALNAAIGCAAGLIAAALFLLSA